MKRNFLLVKDNFERQVASIDYTKLDGENLLLGTA